MKFYIAEININLTPSLEGVDNISKIVKEQPFDDEDDYKVLREKIKDSSSQEYLSGEKLFEETMKIIKLLLSKEDK